MSAMGCIYFWERLKIAPIKTLANVRFWAEADIRMLSVY